MIYKYLNINELDIEKKSERVSEERILRASKFKHESDKKRSIAVEYLLNEIIDEYFNNSREVEENNIKIKTPVSLSYDEKGKPHILEGGVDAVQFSLSHSGDYVACIVSDKICGIDIEKHSDRPYDKIANRVCTDLERSSITNTKEFYDLWTLKESILKATGQGLSLDMRGFSFTKTGENMYSTSVLDETYTGYVLKAPDGYSFSYVIKN